MGSSTTTTTSLGDLYVGQTYHINISQPATVATPYVFTGKTVHARLATSPSGASVVSIDSATDPGEFTISTDGNGNEQVDIYFRVSDTSGLSAGGHYVQVTTVYNAGADEDLILKPTAVMVVQGIT